MEKSKETIEMQDLSIQELDQTIGGGEPDDLAYNIVYFGMRTNPLFWLMKYNVWIANSV